MPSELEALRQQTWKDLLTRYPASFDGELLGLSALEVSDTKVCFRCRKTSYSYYVMTREPDFTERHPGVTRADPIGVTVIVLSRDEKVLVSTRSDAAEQNPGALYFVGGYASFRDEPDETCFFADARREVFEETAVSIDERADVLLLGIFYDPVFCHPEVTVLLRCGEAFDQMERRFNAAVDRGETKDFFGVPLHDLLSGNWPEALKDREKTLSVMTSLSFLAHWAGSSRG